MEPGIKSLIIILGPTGSGKTDLAIKVAKWLDTEIISSDSRQFYRELSIGTAKPTSEQLYEVKHHLIGHISIKDPYNISRFEKDSLSLLNELFKSHDHVVMCGGSGLYIDTVCYGIDEQPDHDPAIRKLLSADFKAQGINYLRGELLRLDPEYYKEVDLSNPYRLMRAIEVSIITGKPYSSYRKGKRKKRNFSITKLGVDVPREDLVKRINLRVDEMIAAGLIDEARALYKFRHLNALNTVGYKELFDYFDGAITLSEAVEQIRINTRRYAKRQMTWFRKDPDIVWVQPDLLNPVVLNQALNR